MSEENNHNFDQTSTEEVIIAENLPMIQSGSQTGAFNRFRKFAQRVGQNQWISQFDLFTTPLKLNYNGEQCYKTEFGGLVYLSIGLFSIIFCLMNQFPNGLQLNNPISFYSLNKDNGNQVTFFSQSDTFFEIYVFNIVSQRRANVSQTSFLLRNISILQIVNNQSKYLKASQDCSVGDFCFKNLAENQNAYLYGASDTTKPVFLQLEINSCPALDTDPVLGMCYDITTNYAIILEITSFSQQTGSLNKTKQKIILDIGSTTITSIDTNIYTTNNNFFGYIANIFSFSLSYYVPIAQSIVKELPIYDRTMDCLDFNTFEGSNLCTVKALYSSGKTNIVTQNFDDITAPLLFFMSITQTLFYLCYILFLRNYSNNSFHLRIADSVVYVPDGQGRHHNFKSGIAVFFGCLLYQHTFVKLLDLILYVTIQRQIKKIMPIKVQLTMQMIAYGESCLGQQNFFNRINSVYQQQNLQPAKLIFDDPEQEQAAKKGEISQKDLNQERPSSAHSQEYFEGQIDKQAFNRMCQQHEYYSQERKGHLCRLLKRTDKNFKLVLIVQELFQQYCRQVKQELGGKQQVLPINFNHQEVSGMSLHRPKP